MGSETKLPPLPKGYTPVTEETLPPIPEGFTPVEEVKKKVSSQPFLDYSEPIPEGGLGTPLKQPSKGSASVPPSTSQIPLPTAGSYAVTPEPVKPTRVDILPYKNQAATLFQNNDLQGAISVLNDGISVATGEEKAQLLKQRMNVWEELGKTKSKADFWIGKVNGEPDHTETDAKFFKDKELADKMEYGKITGDYSTISEKPLEVVAPGVNIGTIAENVVGELATGVSEVAKGVGQARIGAITESPSLVAKGAVKSMAGAMKSAFGIMMNTTPEGIVFQAASAGAKEVVPGAAEAEELLFAPITTIFKPTTEEGKDMAAVLDPIPSMILMHQAAKGSTKAAELNRKIEAKEPLNAQDAIDYTAEVSNFASDPQAVKAVADKAGVEVKTEEQIKAENPEIEVKAEIKPVDKVVENIKAGEPIKTTIAESNIPKEEFDARIESAKFTGDLTEQQIADAKAEYARVEEVKATLPEQHRNNAKVIDLVEQKNELKKQKETTDEAFHPEINAKIDEITKKIQDEVGIKTEAAKEPVVAEKPKEVVAEAKVEEVKPIEESVSPMKEEVVPQVETPVVEQKVEQVKEINPESKVLSEAHDQKDIDFANEMIDEGWFSSTGSLLEKRIDFDAFGDGGIQTSQVLRGIADIKKGKNTAPAKRLIDFLKKVNEKGEMPMLEGTGAQVNRIGVNLAEARAEHVPVPKEITDAQAKEATKVKISETIAKEGITAENFDEFVKENDWLYTPEEIKQIKTHLNETTRQAAGDIPASTPTEGEGAKLGEVAAAKEPTPTAGAEVKAPTPKEQAIKELEDARAAFRKKMGLSSGTPLNALPEFIEVVKAAIKAGYYTAKDFIQAFKEDFPNHTEEEVKAAFEEVSKKPEQLSGIKKELVPEEVAAKVDVEKKTFQQVIDEGKRLVDSGEIDTNTLVNEIANGPGRALQAAESAAMIYHKAKLDNALSSAYKEASEAATKGDTEAKFSAEARIAALEKQLEEYHVMQIKTAYEQGMSLAIRRAMLNSEYDLQAQIVKYKAANNGVIPAEVEAKFREYDKQLKEAQAKLEEAETRAKNAEADLAIKNIKESSQRGVQDVRRDQKIKEASKRIAAKIREGKIHRPNVFSAASPASLVWDGALEVVATTVEAGGTIAQAAKNGWDHIKESEWYKNLGEDKKKEAEDGYKGYIEGYSKDQDVVAGKIRVPQSIIRDLVERGIDNIDDLVSGVREFIKDEYPNATDREIRDAITGYGKTVNLSKDEISTQIRKMKRVGKLMSGIEDAQNKMRPLRSGLQRDRLSKQELDMQRELKGLLKDLPFEEADMEFKQKSALDTMKKRVANRIAEFEKRIEEKDFSPPAPRKVTRMDDEVIKAKAELEKIKEKYDLEHEKNRLAQQSTAKKFFDIAKDIILSIPKSLQASMDMSAPLRQGIVNTLRPSRIKYTGQEFKTMFEQAFSEKKAEDWLHYIKASPEYGLMKQSGLYLAEPNAKLSAREEIYKSNLVQRIPFLKHFFKGSERAYTGFLNAQRVNEFLRVSEKLKKDGIDPTTKEGAEVYKAWANYVNNATGRGSMGQFEMSANKLADVFFSPRLIAARFNTLNPAFYAKMPKAARIEAMKSTLEFIGVGMTALALAKLGGADVETDPRSSNFGKVKIGDTTLDIWGGYVQWVRMIAQVATGERKSASTGKVTELGKGYGSDTRADVVINFFKNKLAPTPALAVRLAESKIGEKGGDIVIKSQYGEETTIPQEILGQTVPLYLQDIEKLAKEHDPSTFTGLMLASFFGFGVQQYKPKKDVANQGYTIK